MKNLLFKSVFLMVILCLASCTDQEIQKEDRERPIPPNYKYTSLDQVEQLGLDVEFDLPEDVYQEFIESCVFIDGKLRGFTHGDVDALLDDQQSDALWAHFGFSIRNEVSTVRYLAAEKVKVHKDYYPLTENENGDGCIVLPNNSCFGSDDDIIGQKPIPGGCKEDPLYICFVPNADNG